MRHSPRIKVTAGNAGGLVYVDGVVSGTLQRISPAQAAKCLEPTQPGWWASGVVRKPPEFRIDSEKLGSFGHKADALRAIVLRSAAPELAQSVK